VERKCFLFTGVSLCCHCQTASVQPPTEALVTKHQAATTGSKPDVVSTACTSPPTQVQERTAAVQQVYNGPPARSGTAHLQPASFPDGVSSNKPPTTAVQQQQHGRSVDKAAINGSPAIDESEVHVSVTGAIKQPPVQQQPPLQSTAIASAGPRSSVVKADEKQTGKDVVVGRTTGSESESGRGGLAIGHHHVEIVSSSGSSASRIVDSPERGTADGRRASFAASSKRAVEVSLSQTSTSGSVKPQSPQAIGNRVDIMPIDPKMQIFDALNASDRHVKTATELAHCVSANDTTTATGAPVGDGKGTRSGEPKSTPSVGLRNGSVTPEGKAVNVKPVMADVRSTVENAKQQTSGAREQIEIKSTTESLTPLTAPKTVPLENDITATVAAPQTSAVSPSSAVSSSSLPRPVTALGTPKFVPITSPSASAVTSSTTSPDGHKSQPGSVTKLQGESEGQ